MNRAIISLGSNIADKAMVLERAMSRLGVTLIDATLPYMDSEDNIESTPYLNIVAVIETDVDHDTLRASFKLLEAEAGRRPEDKVSGLVPLDIDIVMFNDKIMRPADFSRAYFQHGYRLLKTRP